MNEEEKELEKSVALRLSIERMLGKKIRSAQDFVWLSDEIERKQRQRVGVNTLKRMWGYYSDEQTATRTGTLDVLANFVGFKDWQTFCKQDMGENSNFVVSRHLETKRLKEDLHIHISWQPDRDCTVRHLGDSQFVIEEIVNSKLSVGDTFECVLFIEGEPLYLNNLVHEGNPPIAYQIGSKSGVHFEVIED